ncbi:amino acid adenylation domain-containing protein [Actinokineospora sp. NPDC004072]
MGISAAGLPLTGAQLGVWQAQRIDPDGATFRIAGVLEIAADTAVDVDRLAAAVRRAVDETECLHVVFAEVDGEPRQFPTAPACPLPVVDLRAEADPQAAALAWVAAERARPLDLATGPLFAHALLRLADGLVWWYVGGHHLLYDATGSMLLAHRAAARYSGREIDPAPSYAALVHAEQDYLAGPKHRTDADFWTGVMAGVGEPARVLPAAERPADHSHRETVWLDAERTAALRAVAAARGTRLSRLLIAGVAAYTHRVTGASDIVIGLPVTARPDPVTRATPAMLANVVPLRLTVTPDQSVGDLLDHVAARISGALRHSRFRGEEVARLVDAAAGVHGLVGPSVNVIPYHPPLRFDGLRTTVRPLWYGPVSDLSVSVYDDPAEGTPTRVDLDADPGVCQPRELAAHAARLAAVLDALAEPDRRIADIELLAADERAQVLAFGVDEHDSPEVTWPEAFELQAARDPDAVAVVCEDVRLTYGELDARANRLARLLAARGIGDEDVVAVAVSRSADLVVALLGVLKSGAAYLPLDADHPVDRLSYMVSDACAAAVLTDGELPDLGAPVLDLADLAGFDPTPLDVPRRLDAAAYVIYTSGSTGRPKGVVVTHDGIGSLITTAVERLGVDRGSRVAQFASVGFDVAVWDLVMALGTGARVVVVPVERRVAGPELTQYLADHGVTHMILPPSLVAALPAGCALPEGGVLVVGTEMVPNELIARWSDRMRVVVAYGLTEATVNSTLWPAQQAWEGAPPIGGPDPNTRCYILDSALRPVPVGAVGELYVGGRGLARGYRGRPDLTSARFVADPYGPPGARMYRTGDRARWRADGAIDFLGRSDGQLKIRGHRIEPGEVENALMTHPAVAAAAIAVRKDHRGTDRLVGYVVAAGATPAQVRAHVGGLLPAAMVPSAVVLLDRLPLTPNGKTDTAALPDPDWAAGASDVAPRTPAEAVLADCFAAVLGLESVGAHDGFFDLGGDSIVAMQLVSRARAAGLAITPRQVFQHRTVAALAAVATPVETAPDESGVGESGVGEVPVTPIVGWLRNLGAASIDRFHQSVRVRVPASADHARLTAALQAVLDRHDALRATLMPDWELRIAPVGAVRAQVEVSDEPVDAAAGLDPAGGVMLRAVWSPAAGTLLLAVHHLVVDGVSWRILLEDLAAAWAGEPLPAGAPLLRWARTLTEASFEDELPHWLAIEPDAPIGARALDPALDLAATARHREIALDAATTEPLLTTLPAAYHLGTHDVLLTAFAAAVARWRGGGSRVLVDVEGHGREPIAGVELDTTRTVGWFTSVHPVALDPGALDWAEFAAGGPVAGRALAAVKEQLRAVPGHGLGYGVLRHLRGQDLPQAHYLVNYLGRLPATGGDWTPDGPLGAGPDPAMPLGHAVELNAAVAGERLTATLSWAAGVLTDAEAAELAEHWLTALRGLAAHAARPGIGGHTPSDFPLAGLDQSGVDELAGPGVVDILPVTPAQRGIYFHSATTADDVYTVQQVIELAEPVDPGALGAAVTALVARHAPLRTGFVRAGDGRVRQVVAAPMPIPVSAVDADPAAFAAREKAAGFDLATPPLLRCALVGGRTVVLTLHHIVADGWSVPLMLRDLLALLRGAALPPVAPYRDHIAWLAAQDAEATRAAWRSALAGAEPTLLVDPGPPSGRTRAVDVPLSAPAAVLAAARELGLTASTVVHGAWGLLLAAETGRPDVVLGSTVSGRNTPVPGVADMVGLFINTVPVRVRAAAGETLAAVLTRLQDEQSALIEHQHHGLGDIQRETGELFDTLVVVENYPVDPESLRAAGIADVQVHDATHYPVSLMAVPDPARGLVLTLEHDPARVGVRAADGLAARLGLLLDTFAADAATPVAAVPRTADPASGTLAGAVVPLPEESIVDMVARVVAATPDAIAVQGDGGALSYRELDERSDAVAGALLERGVVPGDVVAVELPRSPEWVVALLGVLKTGAAYLPVDGDLPAERREFLLADSRARVVIDAGFTPRPGSAGIRPHPDHGAYVIYTSGSTGRPKGVEVTHRAVVNQLAWLEGAFGLAPGDRVLQKAPGGFDVAVWELFWPLVRGATVVLARPGGHRDPAYLAELIRRERITAVEFVPSLLAAFLDGDPGPLPGLRLVFSGGEALPGELARRWVDTTGIPLHNMYGPTETTIGVTSHTFAEDAPQVPIGGPVWNTTLHVLDACLRPVPPGTPGELYVAGVQLARGYLGQPALTAARFVADPFAADGSRLYRTGDVVVRGDDGALTYLGRTDDQVKIRGNRVELGEVEARVAALPGVARAAAAARGGRLVAWVVPSGRDLDVRALAAAAGERLPSALVPSAFVVVDDFPVTAAGKLDRAALPEPAARPAPVPQPSRSAPTSAVQMLCEVFSEVLNVASVEADDDFFILGGDSILSMSVSTQARRRGLDVSPTDVFTHRTPAALAARLPEAPPAPAPVADSDGVGDVPPLPIVHQLREDGGGIDRFTLPVLVRTPADATLERLTRALDALIATHDALRLRLTRIASVLWTQEITASAQAEITRVDARGLGDADLRALIAAEADAAAGRLAPDAGVVLQAVWFDRGNQPGRLALIAHHLVVDGVSWRVLLGDLARAYAGLPLEPVPTSLRRFARIAHEQAASPARLGELAHWAETLAPGADLVPAHTPATAAEAAVHRVALSVEDTLPLLTTVPAAADADVTEVLLAALRVAVRRWQQAPTDDLLVDLERHGREPLDGVDLSRTVGWFTSVQPVRLPAAGTAAATLDLVRAAVRAAPDHGIGHGLLRHLNAQAAPVLARMARAQVLFNYYGRFAAGHDADFAPAPEPLVIHPDADLALPYALQVDAVCDDTPDGPALTAAFTRGPSLPAADAAAIAEGWIAALKELSAQVKPRALIELTDAEVERVTARGDVEDIWPLSPLQEGLYFHAGYDQGDIDVYTAQDCYDFATPIDVDRLKAALRALARRHPSVRVGFTSDGLSRPVQFVAADPQIPVTEITTDEAGLDRILAEDRTTRFDLASPPLLRVLVLRLPDRDRLVVSHHLLLWDGWSAGIFTSQLLALYRDPHADLPPAGTYRDYLAWLAEQDERSAREAWKAALAGLAEPTLVAPDPGHPAVPRQRRIALSEADTRRLREAARANGVTLNTLLSAAWALTLTAETGRDDVVFGTTVAGRPASVAHVETVIGMFLNTVPHRVALRPDESVAALLRRMQDERTALMAHDYLGLGEIQREAGHDRLFDTLYVLQNFADEDASAALMAEHGITAGTGVDATHYPLTVVITPGTAIKVKLDHRPDLIDDERAEAILTRFATIAGRLAEQPGALVGAMDLLLERERAELAAEWGASANPVVDKTIAQLLAEQAGRTPDATALVFGEQRLTYAELDARINRLARLLIERGAGPEQVVALALPRSVEMVVALFAVLRTGAAYLPLDLDHPVDRLQLMIDDTRPLCLLTTSAQRFTADTVCLDQVDLDAYDPGPVEVAPFSLDHPAYVIYTSGSTGRPKGVVTPYRGLTNMQLNHQEAIFGPAIAAAGGRRLRIAHTVSFAFDMSWEELLWLVEGHEVHVCDEDLRRDAEALVAYCQAHRVDVVNVTPTYAALLIEQGLLRGHVPPLVLLGGEAVADSVWTALRDTDGTYGYNLYGPTEYTINTLGASTEDSETPAVGRPIWNTRAYVLDPHLRPVPPGTPGELHIAGIGLARGYHDRPALTAARFVADPFGAPGDRMYRTGDLVRARRDGIIDFLGRTDDQVKIRGYRVELGEVTSAVSAHPAVAHAAVVATGEVKKLVAYVVWAGQERPDELRAHLRTRLPDYMVPAAIMAVERIPLTVNGKLDVRALPAPRVEAAAAGREPATEAERVLCQLFAEVLGVPRVGPLDNFFELGGHSLLATRVISRARTALGAELAIRDLFEAPTPEELAVRAGRTGETRPAPVAAARPARLPLSPAQRRLWLLQQWEAGSPAYNFPLALRLRGPLHVPAFRAAVRDVVGRHEALRTRVEVHEGVPYQHIVPAAAADPAFELARVDDLAAFVQERVDRPFDLAAELPIRVSVGRIGPDDHVVVVLLHHITTDEWSDLPFLRDLSHAYTARAAGRTPQWTPLPLQYADYTLWQHRLLGDPADPTSLAARQLDFWHRALDGAPEDLELPADRGRPARPTFTGGEVDFALSAAGLRAIAADTGASMFMVLHAAVAALLHRLGAGTDIPLGAPVAGRTDDAFDDLIGFFVNTLVLRADVSGDPRFTELVGRVRETALAALENQDVPFEAVVEKVNPARSPARNPLFQVMVGYHARTGDGPRLGGMRAEWVDHETRGAKFDLVFSFTDQLDADSLHCRLEFARDRFDPATAARLAERLRGLLDAAAADPGIRVSALDVVTDAERKQVVDLFNATDRVVPALTLPELFARCVADGPAKTAVVDGSGVTDYATLDAESDRIAALLAAGGVGEGAVVAIAVPRSARMVATVLAVLKLGAAYLPLDLAHPADRIAYMLADSGAAAMVATAAEAARVPEVGGVRRIVVDHVPDAPAPAYPELTLAHPAYVIYTSGSTGRPKGVVVPHDGIASLAATALDRMRLTPDARVLQFASVGFDVAVFELVMALTVGGALVFCPAEARVAGPALTDFLAAQRITHMILPPSLVAALPADCELPAGSTILVGTEVVPPAVMERWAGKVNILCAYGLTEATVNSTLWQAEPGWTGAVPIGVPDPNTRCYILDEYLRPVPPGVVGELYVGGRGLALGYLGKPGMTAGRFVPSPFGPPGARVYRTGDRARWRADGNIDFLGRADDQVKVRGFRVELGEIEAALAADPAVKQAVVVPDRDGDIVRLAGYVVPADGATPDPAALRAAVADALPEYMVPAVVLVLDGPLPLTPNGKLDRRRLPKPDFAALAGADAPTTPQQAALAALFAEVLGLPRVGVRDGFFDLGGHSMAAMRLLSRIRATLGVDLSIRDVFDAPSVAALAERLAGATAARPPLVATGITGPRPLAPVQRLHLGGDRYDHTLLLRLPEPFDVPALRAALADVAARHAPLRTSVDATGQTPCDPPELEIALGADPAATARAAVTTPWRPVLVAEDALLLLLRYTVVDEWSVVPLVRDVGTAYTARRSGSAPAWAPLPVSYGDYTDWALRVAADPAQLAYWRRELAGLPDAGLATGQRRGSGDAVAFALPADLRADLDRLAAATGTSLFMLLHTAFATLAARHGAGTDLGITAQVAGRGDDQLLDLVGSFANHVVLRVDAAGDFPDVLARVRAATLRALEHQDVPLTDVLADLGLPRPRLAVVHHEQTVLGGEAGARVDALPTGVVHADLTLSGYETPAGQPVPCYLEYADDLFDRTTVEGWSRELLRILRRAAGREG